MKDDKQTRDEFGALYIDELNDVRGGSGDVRSRYIEGRNATTLALGEEGPSPFEPHHDPERPALDLPWLRATQTSATSDE